MSGGPPLAAGCQQRAAEQPGDPSATANQPSDTAVLEHAPVSLLVATLKTMFAGMGAAEEVEFVYALGRLASRLGGAPVLHWELCCGTGLASRALQALGATLWELYAIDLQFVLGACAEEHENNQEWLLE